VPRPTTQGDGAATLKHTAEGMTPTAREPPCGA